MTATTLARIHGMRSLRILTPALVMLVTIACSGSSADPAAGSSAASTGASASSFKAVPHDKLAEVLPTLPGWTREKAPTGDTDSASNVSRVQVNYQQDGGTGGISVEIMDVASNQHMLAPLKELLKVSGTRETASGTQKVITVGGNVATEEWAPQEKNGNVSVLVADRFAVNINGSTVENVGVMHKFVEAIDLKKLASLR
jgi:hypothetical protein